MDSNKLLQYDSSIIAHLNPLVNKFGIAMTYNVNMPITAEDMNHMIEIIKSSFKKNIELNPYLSQEQKEYQQSQYDVQAEVLKNFNNFLSQPNQ